MDYITHDKLASYLSPQVVTEADTSTKIQLANGLVTDIVGAVDPVPTRVVAITLEAAARSVRAAGFTSVTTTTDNTSKTWRREGAPQIDPGVYLSDDEIAELIGIVNGVPAASGAFTIRPGQR